MPSTLIRHKDTDISPLRLAREAKDMSLPGLADRSGLNVRTIERIEAGQVKPHRATLHVLAAVLEVSPDELTERSAA